MSYFCGRCCSTQHLLSQKVEEALGVRGDAILYVGDHIYTDAALVSKNMKWRTALVLRELEQEVKALSLGRPHREKLKALLEKKEVRGAFRAAVAASR